MLSSSFRFIYTVALVAITVQFLVIVPPSANSSGHKNNELDWEGTLIPAARQRFPSSSSSSKAMEGRVVLITGATSGIGLALTRVISHQLGATVLALGRSPKKLGKLAEEIPSVQTFQADFSDLSAVSRVADEIISSFDKIDVVINNAGMFDLNIFQELWGASEALATPQGFDKVFTVNYLSGFLLTEKLTPLLAKSSAPTVVQVSSSYHLAVDGSDLTMQQHKDLDDGISAGPIASHPGGRPGFDLFRTVRSYANSKLAQIFHARALRKHHPLLSSTTTNKLRTASVCPTWVATNIAGGEGFFTRVIATLAFPIDGWGISSALTAVVSSEDDEGNDYYTNIGGFDFTSSARLASLLSWVGLRECVITLVVNSLLFTQRFFTVSAVTTTGSSLESYNEVWAEELYDWSLKTVRPYL